MNLIYIADENGQQGPYDIRQLRSMWENAEVKPDAFFWREGAADWQPLRTIAEELENESVSHATIRIATLPTADVIYIADENGQRGPYDIRRLQTMWDKGEVKPETFFWREGEAAWKPLKLIADELGNDDAVAHATIRMSLPAAKKRAAVAKLVQKNQRKFNSVYAYAPKRKRPFTYLGIGLGLFGVHNFYLGYYFKGIIQLAISVGCIAAATMYTPVFLLGLLGVLAWVVTDVLITQHDPFGENLED